MGNKLQTKLKTVQKNSALAAVLGAAFVLAGCGGGGGGGDTPVSTDGGTITGVAAKGLLSKAMIAAMCGTENINKTPVKTDDLGRYSITLAKKCSTPVMLKVTVDPGVTKMIDETQGAAPVNAPASLTLSAPVPTGNTTANITPLTDLMAQVLDPTKLDDVAIAKAGSLVAQTLAGGMDPLTTDPSDTTMATAISTIAKAGADSQGPCLTAAATDGAAKAACMAAGVADIVTRIKNSIGPIDKASLIDGAGLKSRLGADSAVVLLKNAALTGVNAPDGTPLIADTAVNARLMQVANGTFTPTPPSEETLVLSGVAKAKQFVAKLRTALREMRNSEDTGSGYLRTQVVAINSDLATAQMSTGKDTDIIKNMIDGARLINHPQSGSLYGEYYYLGHCSLQSGATTVNCYSGDYWTMILTAITNNGSGSYAYSTQAAAQSPTGPIPSAAKTGTFTASFDAAHDYHLTAFSIAGQTIARGLEVTQSGQVASTETRRITATGSESVSSRDVNGAVTAGSLTISGKFEELNAAGAAAGTVWQTTGNGLTITATADGATAISGGISMATAGGTKLVGTLSGNAASRTSTGIVTVTSMKIVGSLSSATVADLLAGTFTLTTTDYAGLDGSQPKSPTNYAKAAWVFDGTIKYADGKSVNGMISLARTAFDKATLAFRIAYPNDIVNASVADVPCTAHDYSICEPDSAAGLTLAASSTNYGIALSIPQQGGSTSMTAGGKTVGVVSGHSVAYQDGTQETWY